MTIVRFAPSPTGHFHVGGARTALFNYLYARKTGGKFYLRIEDTDRTRYKPYAVQELLSSLSWLGIDWDDGPSKEELLTMDVLPDMAEKLGTKTSNTFVQSKRQATYSDFAHLLVENGHAYKVFTDQILDRETEKGKFDDVSRAMQLDTWRNASRFMVKKAEATG